MKPLLIRVLAAALLATGALNAMAQPAWPPGPPPQNVLQLNTSSTVEVAHDRVMLTLASTREGPQPGPVQEQLRSVIDEALAVLRPLAQEGQMEVRTGGFSVQPRYGREGRIQSWAGTAEVILEGRDIQRISRAATQAGSLTVSGVSFGLSREQLQRAEAQAQEQAIERFRAKAGELARSFGFPGYELREVTVQSAEQAPPPRPRMMAMEARKADADTAIPVEPGKTQVMVMVNGSVQMRPAAAR